MDKWKALSEVYNMPDVPDKAKSIIGDVMLDLEPSGQERIFVGLVVEYSAPELCTYHEYRGKPYYSIKYIENGETYVGYGTYKPEVLSEYLKNYFMTSAQPNCGAKMEGGEQYG